jgi:hypothetical protein
MPSHFGIPKFKEKKKSRAAANGQNSKLSWFTFSNTAGP